jgi:hypothetical protein
VISGPGNQPESPYAGQPEPPGEFVSDELRDDCARFLDELRTQIHRRGEPVEHAGWVPAEKSRAEASRLGSAEH